MRKTVGAAIAILALCSSLAAQPVVLSEFHTTPGETSQAYSAPVTKLYTPGLKMRNVGRVLTVGGGVLLVTGIILVSSADELYYNAGTSSSGSYESGDPRGGFGVLLTTTGAGMLVTGIILWSKGQRKYNNHKADQAVLLKTGLHRLALTYTF